MTLNGSLDETEGYNTLIKNGLVNDASIVKAVVIPVGAKITVSRFEYLLTSGTADTDTADKLVDSSATFVTDGVAAGMFVVNATDNVIGVVDAVDSETSLSLRADARAGSSTTDVFPDGDEDYEIYTCIEPSDAFLELNRQTVSDSDSIFNGVTLEQSYVNAIPAGLIRHYKMDEASGDVQDSGTSGTELTATGISYGETGIIGDAIGFTDSSDKVEETVAKDIDFSYTDSFSISFWGYFNSFTGFAATNLSTNVVQLGTVVDSPSTQFALALWFDNNGEGFQLALFSHSSDINALELNSTPISTGSYHHIAVVYDSSTQTAELFLDNVSKGSVTYTKTPTVKRFDSLYIGGGSVNARNVDWIVDDFRIYNRKLLSTDLAALYNSGAASITYHNKVAEYMRIK
jgi:hypothetical protein